MQSWPLINLSRSQVSLAEYLDFFHPVSEFRGKNLGKNLNVKKKVTRLLGRELRNFEIDSNDFIIDFRLQLLPSLKNVLKWLQKQRWSSKIIFLTEYEAKKTSPLDIGCA